MENLRLERLKEFKSTLDKDNQVSKSMVIALEEFIGDNVITKQVNPNKLTNLPSLTQLDTIKTIVDNEIKSEQEKVSVDEVYTAEDIVTLLNGKGGTILSRLQFIMVLLAKSDSGEGVVDPAIKVAAMTDEKIRYRYVENEDGSILTDILTLPIDHVYVNYKSYFEDVKSYIYGELAESRDVLPEIYPQELNAVSLKYNALLNIIDSVALDQAVNIIPKPITLKDIITIIQNAPVIIDKIESWRELAGKYWHTEVENLNIDVDINNLYRGLTKLAKDDDLLNGKDFITDILQYMFTKPKRYDAVI